MNFRANIVNWLGVLASNAAAQIEAAGLPEELRLGWDDVYFAVDDRRPSHNREGITQFTAAERRAINGFDDYLWSLPPDADSMWDSDALNNEPWPQVRAKASALLELLQRGG